MCGNQVGGFCGLADLAIVLGILGAGGWLIFRLERSIARGES